MLREEAEKCLGKPVICKTILWGVYIAELLEISPKNERAPWRGKVRILAVKQYPIKGYDQLRNRKPFKFGNIREFGGTSINKYNNDKIPSYDESLILALAQLSAIQP